MLVRFNTGRLKLFKKIYFINIVPYFPVYFTKQEWISWKMENLKMVRFPFWTRQREGFFRIILCRSDIKTLTLCGDKNKDNFSWSQQVMLNQFRFVCCHPVTIFRILNSRIRNTIFLVFFFRLLYISICKIPALWLNPKSFSWFLSLSLSFYLGGGYVSSEFIDN